MHFMLFLELSLADSRNLAVYLLTESYGMHWVDLKKKLVIFRMVEKKMQLKLNCKQNMLGIFCAPSELFSICSNFNSMSMNEKAKMQQQSRWMLIHLKSFLHQRKILIYRTISYSDKFGQRLSFTRVFHSLN